MLFWKKGEDTEDNRDSRDSSDKKIKGKRKGKKEEAPWGKKERFLVLLVLLLTAGGSGLLALSARKWKLPGFPRLKFSVPSFPKVSFLEDESFVLEGDKNLAKERDEGSRVIQRFYEITDDYSGVYGLYVVDLKSHYSYGVNEVEGFQAASLIKLPVMVAMYLEAEAGNVDLDTKYSLKETDKLDGAGSLRQKPQGYEITYRNLIRLMGKESDNTAFNIVSGLLGEEKMDSTIESLGMVDTDLGENLTTARDIGILFEGVWRDNVLNPENKDEFFGFLTDTLYESLIPEGVPEDVVVAHKYGSVPHVLNDAGVVFSNEPFVLVLVSKGIIEDEANKVISEIARVVYKIESE